MPLYHTTKALRRVEMTLHAFIISALGGKAWLVSGRGLSVTIGWVDPRTVHSVETKENTHPDCRRGDALDSHCGGFRPIYRLSQRRFVVIFPLLNCRDITSIRPLPFPSKSFPVSFPALRHYAVYLRDSLVKYYTLKWRDRGKRLFPNPLNMWRWQ